LECSAFIGAAASNGKSCPMQSSPHGTACEPILLKMKETCGTNVVSGGCLLLFETYLDCFGDAVGLLQDFLPIAACPGPAPPAVPPPAEPAEPIDDTRRDATRLFGR
jgi:hypothetical protein